MSTTVEEKMKEIADAISNETRRDAHADRASYIANNHNPYDPAAKGGIYALEEAIAASQLDYLNNDNANKAAPLKVENPDLVDKIDPSIVKSPMEVVKDAKEAQAFSDYVNSLYSQSDYEADEKRKKAAQWVTAAQILGDSLAALGNVYWTGKGAAPQQLSPGTGKAAAATHQLEQDIRNAREKAAKAKYELDKARKEWEYRVEQDKLARQERKDATARAQANADRDYNFRVEQYKDNKDFREQSRLDNLDQWNKTYNIQLKRVSKEMEKYVKENRGYRFDSGDGFVEIPKEYVNEQTIGAIFQLLPEEDRIKAGKPRYGTGLDNKPTIVGYDNPDLREMLAAIGMNMDNAEVVNAIKRLGGKEQGGETKEEFKL